MSILSNYELHRTCRGFLSRDRISRKNILNPQDFAERFVQAVQIAEVEPFRAVTHNKGIMNGVDAVVLATGSNDFRAVEADSYMLQNQVSTPAYLTLKSNGVFTFWLEIPLALGTVGLTTLHPLVKLSLEMLKILQPKN
jgi:hydroxymethylglutaryl-CoA reductase